MSFLAELEECFGKDGEPVSPAATAQHLERVWAGSASNGANRALKWRFFLGLIDPSDKGKWAGQLLAMADSYQGLKAKVMPSLDKVKMDPLSALSSGETQSDEWSTYYKNVDLISFIRNDLDRLYITGIEDGFFQSKQRRDALLAILLIWAYHHPVLMYKQGMHEVAGYVLFCVEEELAAWQKTASPSSPSSSSPTPSPLSPLSPSSLWAQLGPAFQSPHTEAYTYHLFARIMDELEPLYDPVSLTPKGAENLPFVVQYCVKLQEHYLRNLDPQLCTHLEEQHVAAQLYGMRWSRLLLGREFSAEGGELFRLWDYLFACCFEAENSPPDPLLDCKPNYYSVLAAVRVSRFGRHANQERRQVSSLGIINNPAANESAGPDVPAYVCTPLLGALGDVMLAMLLQIREQLVSSDASSLLSYLMHYPETEPVARILELAYMIKCGTYNAKEKAAPPADPVVRSPLGRPDRRGEVGQMGGQGQEGAWIKSVAMNDMKTRMVEKFQSVTSLMGSGLLDIVSTLAEDFDSQEWEGDSGAEEAEVRAREARVRESEEVRYSYSEGTERSSVAGRRPPTPGKEGVSASTSASTSTSASAPTEGESAGYHLRSRLFGVLSSKEKPRERSDDLVMHKMPSRQNSLIESRSASANSESAPASTSLPERTGPVGGWGRTGQYDSQSQGTQTAPLEGGHVCEGRGSQVADRLLDLADLLVRPAHSQLGGALTPSQELQHEAGARKDAVKKLRILADVLSGLVPLQEYDQKCISSRSGAGAGSKQQSSDLT